MPNVFTTPDVGTAARASYKAIAAVADVAGLMDLGGIQPWAREVSQAWVIPTQRYMDGEISAQDVLDQFEAAANEILAQ